MAKKKDTVPGQREAAILSCLLSGDRYGLQIRADYEKRTGVELPLGSLYVTLERMLAKHLVVTRIGESNPERGGNRRKYYGLTDTGLAALNQTLAAFGIAPARLERGARRSADHVLMKGNDRQRRETMKRRRSRPARGRYDHGRE